MGIRVPSLLFVAGWQLVENKVRVHTLLFVEVRTSSKTKCVYTRATRAKYPVS